MDWETWNVDPPDDSDPVAFKVEWVESELVVDPDDFAGLMSKLYAMGGLINVGPCMATKDRITLPNGMAIWYNDLRWLDNKKYRGWVFDYAGRTKMIWGGTVVENLCQSLARIILMDHALDIRRETGFRPKLNVHDELVYVVPETVAEDFLETGTEIMHRSSDWCPDLPVAAEGAMGDSYGDCK